MKRILALAVALAMTISLGACSGTAGTSGSGSGAGVSGSSGSSGSSESTEYQDEHALVLKDGDTTLDGTALSEEGAVTLTHDIIYYEDRDTYDSGADYGEGTEAERHSAEDAAAHTVITIREAGTYRVSGTLSPGQLAVDLGDGCKDDPSAVVTLILDGADITCNVAPAVIFYRVYECDQAFVAWDDAEDDAKPDYTPSPDVDTSQAGARVILADSSSNTIKGSHVARIYEDGSDKKLHKYDGAFYSRRSMVIDGEEQGSGVLNIEADNEGLDSELHLTINGGYITIVAQNDGINTNEDGVSVTAINGGTLQVNAGLGEEGDGIDSNGYLIINGGNVYSLSSDHSGDGGLDADSDIQINGGYVAALGVRNDAVSSDSKQLFMELYFASTVKRGSEITLQDPDGTSIVTFTTDKDCQSIIFSSGGLKQDVAYTLLVNGTVQQYTGNMNGGFGGGRGPRPEGMDPGQNPDGDSTVGTQPPELPTGQEPDQQTGDQPPEMPDSSQNPDGQTPEGEPSGEFPQGQRPDRDWKGGKDPGQIPDGERPQRPDGMRPDVFTTGEPSEEFTLTDTIHSFSGISDTTVGKTAVTFSAQISVEDGTVTVSGISADPAVDPSHVQITIVDMPSENFSGSCLWSDGDEALQAQLPTTPGLYEITFSVINDDTYAGTSQFEFRIPES